MNGAPKEKPPRGGKGLQTNATAYHALDLVQAPFGFVFWIIERWKAKVKDRVENERSGQ
jgi:hypothetical protein